MPLATWEQISGHARITAPGEGIATSTLRKASTNDHKVIDVFGPFPAAPTTGSEVLGCFARCTDAAAGPITGYSAHVAKFADGHAEAFVRRWNAGSFTVLGSFVTVVAPTGGEVLELEPNTNVIIVRYKGTETHRLTDPTPIQNGLFGGIYQFKSGATCDARHGSWDIQDVTPIGPGPGASPQGSIAFYGDSLTGGDGTFVGYIGVGLVQKLKDAGFLPVDAKGCGGMQLSQFVGRVATNPANACQAPNTFAAHQAAIATADTVVVAFVANDYASSSAQFRADAQSAVDQIKAKNPQVKRIVFIHNYIGNGTHDGDLDFVAAAQPALVHVIDVQSAFNNNYSANCSDPNKQNHPTDACSLKIVNDMIPKIVAIPFFVPAAGSRPAQDWPFAGTSLVNTSVGDGITFDPACPQGYFGGLVMSPNYDNGFGRSIRFPNAPDIYLPQNASNPIMEGHVMEIGQAPGHVGDRRWGADYYQHDHPSAGTYQIVSVDLFGDGFPTDNMPHTSSSTWSHVTLAGYSNIFGLIRTYDWRVLVPRYGYIPHALCCTLTGPRLKMGYIYPATGQDGDAGTPGSTLYSGNCPMGGALIIPWGQAKPAGLSYYGNALFETLRRFPIYVFDRGPNAVAVESNLKNFSTTQGGGWDAYRNSGEFGSKISPLLTRISNNTAANKGGPGNRRATHVVPALVA